MSDEFGNDYITLIDEDGKEIDLEHLDTVEYEGETYMAFLPAQEQLSESYDLLIMKIETENGEEILVTLDDEEEEAALFQIFSERLEESFFEEEEGGASPPDEEAEAAKEGY